MTVSSRSWARLGLFATFLWGVGASCQSPESLTEQDIVSAVQQGRYGDALERARLLAAADPHDSAAQTLYRDARVAFLLDQGRDEVFHGDLTRGMEHFVLAREIAPGHPMVESWIEKTRAQLAVHWLDVAADRTGPEQLAEAEHAYEKVLLYDPENEDAIRGLSHVLLLRNYRAGLSKTYFDDGLTSFQQLLLQQARRSFQVSRRYMENDPAALRAEQVEAMMAEERLASARDLEASGLFFAARNEYRLVLLIDPKSVSGREGLDRMDREARATRTLAAADMEIRRGEFEDAEESLAQAEVLTEAQTDHVSLLRNDIAEKNLEEMYLQARSYYRDYRYPEAVEAYAELLAVAPDYKDAALRKATVEEFIRLAEEFYAKALAAEDDAEAEEYLRTIHPIIWPEYRDVVERLDAIEARKAAARRAAEEAGAGEAPQTDPPGDDGGQG